MRTELRNRHWTNGYITVLRGELDTPHLPESQPQHDDESTPAPTLLQAVLDGLRKL